LSSKELSSKHQKSLQHSANFGAQRDAFRNSISNMKKSLCQLMSANPLLLRYSKCLLMKNEKVIFIIYFQFFNFSTNIQNVSKLKINNIKQ